MYKERLKEMLSILIGVDYDICLVSCLNINNVLYGDSNLFHKFDDIIEFINLGMEVDVIAISKFRIKLFLKDDKNFKSIRELTITKEQIKNFKKWEY